MGEGDNNNKNNGGGGGGGGDGGKKKEGPSPINVVLKVHMHCDGCATRIIKCVKSFEGVECVKAEWEKSKLTVVGIVDPVKVREKLAKKTKKQIELVSPLPKKDKDGGDKKSEQKTEQSSKEPPVTTVVLKIPVHCHGCCEKINRFISKFKGVCTVNIDEEKELVTVKGTMDTKALQGALKEKFKRPVEIVPPKKDKDGGGGGGQKQKGDGDGGKKEEKKGGGGGGGGDGGKTDVSKMEYYGYGYGYILGPGYFVDQVAVYPPQLFSDENPNACNIM